LQESMLECVRFASQSASGIRCDPTHSVTSRWPWLYHPQEVRRRLATVAHQRGTGARRDVLRRDFTQSAGPQQCGDATRA
jgi:hypothetical protein